MPTSLILMPTASIQPDLVNTRTEVLSNWRFRRRLSCLKLRLNNIGRGAKDKVAHGGWRTKITKVHCCYRVSGRDTSSWKFHVAISLKTHCEYSNESRSLTQPQPMAIYSQLTLRPQQFAILVVGSLKPELTIPRRNRTTMYGIHRPLAVKCRGACRLVPPLSRRTL
jgi:hypothetical protein